MRRRTATSSIDSTPFSSPASVVVARTPQSAMALLHNSLALLFVVASLGGALGMEIAAGKQDYCRQLESPKNGRVFFEKYGSSQMAEFVCYPGFALIGQRWLKCPQDGKWSGAAPSCVDINECALDRSLHPCSEHAHCVNSVGSFACVCRRGFAGNGKKCLRKENHFLRHGDKCGTVSIKKFNDSMRYRRIVGGREVAPGEWPWQVMIKLNRKVGLPFAGGALIEGRWVVTLASMLRSGSKPLAPSDVTVVLGDYDRRKKDFHEQQYRVKRIVLYPGFDSSTLDKDIALLELEKEARLGTYVNKVCLVSGRKARHLEKSSSVATISGWGTTRAVKIGGRPGDFSDVLQEVNLPLVASGKCQRATVYSFNARSQICAGFYTDRKSPCYGDAGSPLVTQDPDSGRWVLIGLFSWSEGCGQKHKFSYYTRVAKFRRWIVQVMRNS